MGKTVNRKKVIKALKDLQVELQKYKELKDRIQALIDESMNEKGEEDLEFAERIIKKIISSPSTFKDLTHLEDFLDEALDNFNILLETIEGLASLLSDILNRLVKELQLTANLEEKLPISEEEILIAEAGINTLKEISELIGYYAKKMEEALEEVKKRLKEEEK